MNKQIEKLKNDLAVANATISNLSKTLEENQLRHFNDIKKLQNALVFYKEIASNKIDSNLSGIINWRITEKKKENE